MRYCLDYIVHLKFTDHSDVVEFTGIFYIQDIRLPPGWKQRLTPDGRTIYTDHNTRTTTWVSSTYVWKAQANYVAGNPGYYLMPKGNL